MKIAICLSGMVRNFENTYPSFKKFIIDEHNPDIFFSGYPNSKGFEYCESKIIELYSPKKIIIQEYTDDLRKMICNNEEKYKARPETKVNNFLSQMYNIKKCDLLRQEYEKENNFKYDVVIRSRIDVFYFKKFEEKELQMAQFGYILIPTEWDFKTVNIRAVSDSFAMTNSKNMTKYSNLYNNFDEYYNAGVQIHPETIFGFHLIQQGLTRIEIPGHGWYKFENIETGKNDDRHGY
jgi:hypothetical protein